MPPSTEGEITSLALKSASCSSVKRVSSSSSWGARNSSSTTHCAGRTEGRSATAVPVCATSVVRTPLGGCGCLAGSSRVGACTPGPGPCVGGCGSEGVFIGGCGSCRVGACTPGPGPCVGGCGSEGVFIGGCGSCRVGACTPGPGPCVGGCGSE